MFNGHFRRSWIERTPTTGSYARLEKLRECLEKLRYLFCTRQASTKLLPSTIPRSQYPTTGISFFLFHVDQQRPISRMHPGLVASLKKYVYSQRDTLLSPYIARTPSGIKTYGVLLSFVACSQTIPELVVANHENESYIKQVRCSDYRIDICIWLSLSPRRSSQSRSAVSYLGGVDNVSLRRDETFLLRAPLRAYNVGRPIESKVFSPESGTNTTFADQLVFRTHPRVDAYNCSLQPTKGCLL